MSSDSSRVGSASTASPIHSLRVASSGAAGVPVSTVVEVVWVDIGWPFVSGLIV